MDGNNNLENNNLNNETPNSNELTNKPTLDNILNGENTNLNNNSQNEVLEETHIEPVVETLESLEQPKEELKPTIETLDNNDNTASDVKPIENNNVVETEILDLEPPQSSVNDNTLNSNIPTIDNDTLDFNKVPAPPVFDDENKKGKNSNKSKPILIVILIFILIIAIGFGVYYVLNTSKNISKKSVTPKDVKVELGTNLSSDISSYAIITGYNEDECSITNNANKDKVGSYNFTVTCGKSSVDGIIIVDDTISPKVVTSPLILMPNATVLPEDFVEQCIDASKCSYEFTSDISLLTSTLGTKEVNITVSDEYNNKTTVTEILTIEDNAPARFITCQKIDEELNELNASLTDAYKIGISNVDNFISATRISEFKFKTSDAYNNAKNSYDENIGINNIKGTPIYEDNSKKVIIRSNKTLEDMNNDLDGILPENVNVLKAYMFGHDYTCN